MIILINGVIHAYDDPIDLFCHYIMYLSREIHEFNVLSLTDSDLKHYLTTLKVNGDYIKGNLGPILLRNLNSKKLGPAFHANTEKSQYYCMLNVIKTSKSQNNLPNYNSESDIPFVPLHPGNVIRNNKFCSIYRTLQEASTHFKLNPELSTDPIHHLSKMIKFALKFTKPYDYTINQNLAWIPEHLITTEDQKSSINTLLKKLNEANIPFPYGSYAGLLTDYEDTFLRLRSSTFLKESAPVSDFARYCVLVKHQIFKNYPGTRRDFSKFWKIAEEQWNEMSEEERGRKVLAEVRVHRSWADPEELRLFVGSEGSEEEGSWFGIQCARRDSGLENIMEWDEKEQAEQEEQEDNTEGDTVVVDDTYLVKEGAFGDVCTVVEKSVQNIDKGKDLLSYEKSIEIFNESKLESDSKELMNNEPTENNKYNVETELGIEIPNMSALLKPLMKVYSDDCIINSLNNVEPSNKLFKDKEFEIIDNLETCESLNENTMNEEISTVKIISNSTIDDPLYDHHVNLIIEAAEKKKSSESETLIQENLVISEEYKKAESKIKLASLNSNHLFNIERNDTPSDNDETFVSNKRNIETDNTTDDSSQEDIEINKELYQQPGILSAMLDESSSASSIITDLDSKHTEEKFLDFEYEQKDETLPEKIEKFENLSGGHMKNGLRILHRVNTDGSIENESDKHLESDDQELDVVKKFLKHGRKRSTNGLVRELKQLIENKPEFVSLKKTNFTSSLPLEKHASHSGHRAISEIFGDLLDDNMKDLCNSAEYRNQIVLPQHLYERIKIKTDKPWGKLSKKTKEKYYGAFLRKYEGPLNHPEQCNMEIEDIIELVKVCADFEDSSHKIIRYAFELTEATSKEFDREKSNEPIDDLLTVI